MTQRKTLYIRIVMWLVIANLVGFVIQLYYFNPRHHATTAEDFYYLSKRYDMAGKTEKALKAATEAVKLDPEFGKAYLQLGYLQDKEGDVFFAVQNTKKALELLKNKDRQNEARSYANLGSMYQELGNTDLSWQHYRAAYKQKEHGDQTIWKTDPKYDTYFVSQNDFKGFAKNIEKAKDYAPRGVHKRLKRINGLVHWHQYKKAIADAERFLQDNPEVSWRQYFHTQLAHIYHLDHQDDKVLEHLEQALKYDQTDEDRAWVKMRFARVYIEQGKFDLAIPYIEEIKEKYLKYEDADAVDLLYAKALYGLGKTAQAEELYKEIYKRDPTSYGGKEASEELLEIYQFSGRYNEYYSFYFGDMPPLIKFGAPLLASVAAAGAATFLLLIIHKVFFEKRVPIVRRTRFRLRHLFYLLILSFTLQPYLWLAFLSFNYYVFDIFSRFSIDPLFLSSLLNEMITVAAILYLFNKIYRMNINRAASTCKGWRHDVFIPLALVIFLFVLSVIYDLVLQYFGVEDTQMPSIEEMAKHIAATHNISQAILLWTSVVVIGPIVEEVIYRLFLIHYLKKYTQATFAVIVSSLLFMLSHDHVYQWPMLFITGLVLSFTYLRTKSLVPCIIIHCLYNLLVTVLYLVTRLTN